MISQGGSYVAIGLLNCKYGVVSAVLGSVPYSRGVPLTGDEREGPCNSGASDPVFGKNDRLAVWAKLNLFGALFP